MKNCKIIILDKNLFSMYSKDKFKKIFSNCRKKMDYFEIYSENEMRDFIVKRNKKKTIKNGMTDFSLSTHFKRICNGKCGSLDNY